MIIPPLLKPGNKAIIIAPAGKVPEKGIDSAINVLRQWGLEVTLGSYVFSSDGVFAGTDAQRLYDIQLALDDPEVALIICARGGYGLTRILDKITFTKFYTHPKWLVGFSDITAFHLSALKQDILSIHGPMCTSFRREGAEDSIIELNNLLVKGLSEISVQAPQLKSGQCQGQLVGGNLSLVCDSLGTSTELDTYQKILMLEDVGDYYYRIDRLLNQLARADKLSKLRGLVIGKFSDLLNGESIFLETINDMILRLTAEYNYPIAVAMPIGHEPQNYPFVQGAEYTLEVKKGSARLELQTKL